MIKKSLEQESGLLAVFEEFGVNNIITVYISNMGRQKDWGVEGSDKLVENVFTSLKNPKQQLFHFSISLMT